MAANSSTDTSSAKKPPQGVYKNPRLMHVCTTIVGSTVRLQTKDGPIWEGIFNTFSPEFTICLDYAVQIDQKLLNTKDCLFSALKSGSQVKKQAFFDLKDIVSISAHDVDLNYATKEAMAKLATDSDISGYDANKSTNFGEHKQLESWQDDDGETANDDNMLSLDDVASGGCSSKNGNNQNDGRGWDPQEMFNYNERVHKVTTTYDDKLTDYTLPLPKPNTKDWRKKQDRAIAIAKEIECNTKSQSRLAKENDNDDEEEKYSAVIRPVTNPRAQPTIKPPIDSSDGAPEDSRVTGPGLGRPIPNRQNGTYKNYRNSRYERNARLDSLKNFGKQLTLAPSPRQHAHQLQQQQPQHHHQQHPQHQTQQHQPQTQPQQQQQQHQPQQHQPQQQQQQQHQHQPQPQQQQQHPQQQQQQQQPQQQQQHPQQQQQQHQPPQQQPQQQQQSQHHQPHTQTPNQQSHQQQPQQSKPLPAPQQAQGQIKSISANPSPIPTTSASSVNTSTISERSDSSSLSSQAKDHQSELARKSKLNPNAKEFKPRSPGASQVAQNNGAISTPTSGASNIDPNNSSPMSQPPHTPYYQPVPMIPLGLSPQQQQHHAAQFMPNHTHPQQHHAPQFMPNHTHPHFPNQIHYMSPVHPHFPNQNPYMSPVPPHSQNQIHYMSPVPPHFAQQMPQRWQVGRGNHICSWNGNEKSCPICLYMPL